MGKHLDPLEKEFLIKRFKSNTEQKLSDYCDAIDVSYTAFKKWLKQYDEQGIEGLARADSALGDVLPEGIDRTEENYKREILKLRIENERLKKLYSEDTGQWGASIRSFKTEEYEVIEILSREYDIKELCELMGVSRSGYYKWKSRGKSGWEKKREEIIEIVENVHKEHPSHGYRWVHAYISINYAVTCSASFVYKIFRYLGIQSETKHKESHSREK
ncbi:MAG: hypothetical protein ACOX4R_06295 [Lentihominibacter sp.]|jgi:transposase-like protein